MDSQDECEQFRSGSGRSAASAQSRLRRTPKRFVRRLPQLLVLPHVVWINPPKEQSASQDRADATSSTADLRAAQNVEVPGVAPETTEGLRHPVATPTNAVLHDMPTASVSTSSTRSGHETLSSVG